jgi:transcriptional regulator with XRE-family HTH domain
MRIKGRQVVAARNLLGMTQRELADASGVAHNTLARFEAGTNTPQAANMEKIKTELEKRGIEFLNGTGIGVRLDYERAEKYAGKSVQAELG